MFEISHNIWQKKTLWKQYCLSEIPRGQLTIHQTQAETRYVHLSILAGGSWRLENPNMQRGRGFCCRKPLMQLRETGRAWIILLQFGSWRGSLHYILWRLQLDWHFNKRRPWGYFGVSVTLQCCFQSCLQINQMSLSTPHNAETLSLNHLPVQTCSLHFRTVWIVNELLGRYMQWCTSMRCDKKVLYNLFFYWVQSVLLLMLQRAKFKTSSLSFTASAAAISFFFCFFFFNTPHTRWKKRDSSPWTCKTHTASFATVKWGGGGGGHLLTDAFAHSCTRTSEVTHKVWGDAQQHMAKQCK